MKENYKWTNEQLKEIYKTEYKGYLIKNENGTFLKQWKTKVSRELIVDKYSTEKSLAIKNPKDGSIILFPKKFIYDKNPEKSYILLSAYSNMMYWQYERGKESNLIIKTQLSGWQLNQAFKAFNFCTILILACKKAKQFLLKKKQTIVNWFNNLLIGLDHDLSIFKLSIDDKCWLDIYFEYKRKMIVNSDDLKWFEQQAQEQLEIEQKGEKYSVNYYKRKHKNFVIDYNKYEVEYI